MFYQFTKDPFIIDKVACKSNILEFYLIVANSNTESDAFGY